MTNAECGMKDRNSEVRSQSEWDRERPSGATYSFPHSAFRDSAFQVRRPGGPSRPHSAFFLIVLLAGLMRFVGLDHCPPGLFRDEAEKGYNAWALASTGGALDFSGGVGPGPAIRWRPWPWMIDVMGGKTSAIYQYAAIPFVRAGGLNVATTRMAAAAVGTLTVALLGLLLWRAWGAWPGLTAAAWLALCPWHLVFSRWALEGIFVPCFLVLTLAGLWGIERGRRWGEPLAGAALGWLFYSYSGAQPFVIAWGICLLILYRRAIHWKAWPCWLGLALFLLPVIPTVLVRLEPGGSSRLARIAIWSANEPGITPMSIAYVFIRNYFAHLDPRFLFFSGDALPRHGVPHLGQLLLIDILLLPVGLWRTLRGHRPLAGRWPLAGALVAAFLCGPIPAALTHEGIPHALRSFAMVVPAAAWSGLGLVTLAEALFRWMARRSVPPARRRLWVGLFVAASLLVGFNAFKIYWQNGRTNPLLMVAFEAGERQTWETIARQRRPGQRVFINGNIPYIPYYQLFFLHLAPRRAALEGLDPQSFIYFSPEQTPPDQVAASMRPGDWMIGAVSPASLTVPPDDRPLLTPDEARRVHEAWIVVNQKP
jgi:hypothetical protein